MQVADKTLLVNHILSSIFFFEFQFNRSSNLINMGADANTKQIVCSRAAELLSVDMKASNVELFQQEDSTLPIAKAIELVKECRNFATHEEELETCKKVGSKTPILPSEIGTDPNYKFTFVWFNTIGFVMMHIIGLTGGLAAILGYCSIWTSIYCKQNDECDKNILIFTPQILHSHFHSTLVNLCCRSRCDDGSSQTLEPSRFQSSKMVKNCTSLYAHTSRTKLSLGLGSRSQTTS